MAEVGMLELYHLPNSICSQKVRLCLAEKGLEWAGHIVRLGKFEHLTPEYLALNPNGVVPTLLDDGRPVVESTVICEYLEELHPEPPLAPADPYQRARMRAWLRFIDETPSMAVRVPSFNDVLLPGYRTMPPDEFKAQLDRMSVRKSFFRRMGQDGFPPEDYADALDQLGLTLERIAAADGFLVAGRISIADLCLAPVVQRMQDLGLMDDASRLSVPDATLRAARRWLDQLRRRESWGIAFQDDAYMQA